MYEQYDQGETLLQFNGTKSQYSCSLPNLNTFGEGALHDLRTLVRKLDTYLESVPLSS